MELIALPQVEFYDDSGHAWQTWRLIPVKAEGTFTPSSLSSETPGSGPPPSYDRDVTGEPSTRAQRVESKGDDLGTIVTEVTTITTRKRYRVQDV
jgi:hypothetical protein